EEKARQVTEQKAEVELKNQEVEAAKTALEEKAEQLGLTSKYKSEFLANMSHELRTPLNSLLILSQQLADNLEGNLVEKQVEFGMAIRPSGIDLLALINEVLDLAKLESGTMALSVSQVELGSPSDYVERSFKQVAVDKRLEFSTTIDPKVPRAI